MRNNQQPWRQARAAMGQRLFLGAVVAGSLTLVAFEWRSTEVREHYVVCELPIEDPWDEPVIVLGKERRASNEPATTAKTATLDPLKSAQPTTDPAPDPGPETGDPVVVLGPVLDPVPASDGTAELPPTFVPGRSIKPHFEQCLVEEPDGVDPCTEERIHAHLQRKFQMPRSVHGRVSTTVTFSVEVDGSVGRIVCVPKVEPEVAREVERVLRSMPRFIPGSQGGVAVPVYYQIPLRLTTG